MIASAWWLSTSSKFTTWEEVNRQPESFENGSLLSRYGFVQKEHYRLFLAIYRIKMHESTNPTLANPIFQEI